MLSRAGGASRRSWPCRHERQAEEASEGLGAECHSDACPDSALVSEVRTCGLSGERRSGSGRITYRRTMTRRAVTISGTHWKCS